MSSSDPSRKRRNGQPQACEICRKAKIRCDHRSPTCGRCLQRNLQCVYHPAPMTRVLGARVEKRLLTPDTTPPESAPQLPTTSTKPLTSVTTEVAPTKAPLFSGRHTEWATTRFSAVFSENQASFGPALLDVDESEGRPRGTMADVDQDPKKKARMDAAIDMLLEFPSQELIQSFLSDADNSLDVWTSPMMARHCLEQIWKEYGDHLGEQRSRETVAQMAADLFENTKKPVQTDDENDDWHNWFGGPNLRWDMIGIIFTWLGFRFKQAQDRDPIFDFREMAGHTRTTAAEKMRDAADQCLEFCEDVRINDVSVVLVKNRWKLQSIIISDESEQLVTGSGLVCSYFITAGLHRLPAYQQITPNSFYRTSLSASLYYLDKCGSLFSARPPMLSHHYCHCVMPPDLSEEDVYNGQERLTAAVAKLDENGWNTEGKILPTTFLRALCLQCPIREAILDFSLGMNVQFTKTDIDNLLARLEDIVASYPAHIKFIPLSSSPQALHNDPRCPLTLYITSRIQLEALQCKFLIHRLSVSRGFSNGQELLDTAIETMSILLSCWLNRERLGPWTFSFNWLVVTYGIPSAGVLCVELLKSTKAENNVLRFSRSGVIQSLTMFIGFLDWVRPTDGNAELCWKVKTVVKRIVDGVLDGTTNSVPSSAGDASSSGQGILPLVDIDVGRVSPDLLSSFDPQLLGVDDLDWLNTVDWTQGDWLDMNHQSL